MWLTSSRRPQRSSQSALGWPALMMKTALGWKSCWKRTPTGSFSARPSTSDRWRSGSNNCWNARSRTTRAWRLAEARALGRRAIGDVEVQFERAERGEDITHFYFRPTSTAVAIPAHAVCFRPGEFRGRISQFRRPANAARPPGRPTASHARRSERRALRVTRHSARFGHPGAARPGKAGRLSRTERRATAVPHPRTTRSLARPFWCERSSGAGSPRRPPPGATAHRAEPSCGRPPDEPAAQGLGRSRHGSAGGAVPGAGRKGTPGENLNFGKRRADAILKDLAGSDLAQEASGALATRLKSLASLGGEATRAADQRLVEGLVLRAANLVFATTNSGDLERLLEERGQFDWAIIEEAGKATGVELLLPLLLSYRRLMIGDHRQLPPFGAERLGGLLGCTGCPASGYEARSGIGRTFASRRHSRRHAGTH